MTPIGKRHLGSAWYAEVTGTDVRLTHGHDPRRHPLAILGELEVRELLATLLEALPAERAAVIAEEREHAATVRELLLGVVDWSADERLVRAIEYFDGRSS